MSYRGDLKRDRSCTPPRGEKRGRSRSPPRRDRSRSSDRRDYNDRRDTRDNRDYKDRYNSRADNDNHGTKDEFGRLKPVGFDRNDIRREIKDHLNRNTAGTNFNARDNKQSKAELEQARKDRMELVKNLTGDKEDNSKPKPLRELKEGETIEDLQQEQEEEEMMAALGFGGFNSTKGKQVEDNVFGSAVGGLAKHKERKYRQYMNRRGGFNRPLQKMD